MNKAIQPFVWLTLNVFIHASADDDLAGFAIGEGGGGKPN